MENINIILRAKGIDYQEGDKKLKLFVNFLDLWPIDLTYVRNWNHPYEYEVISTEHKQQILKNVQSEIISKRFYDNVIFDFSKKVPRLV